MRKKIEHFDSLSLSAINYLERHICVSDIALQGPVECPQHEIVEWERENHPFKLPEDYKAFLQNTNGRCRRIVRSFIPYAQGTSGRCHPPHYLPGFYLKWSAWIRGRSLPYGCMHINSLAQVKRIAGQESNSIMGRLSKIVFFDLDSKCSTGRVAFRYRGMPPTAPPEVWFRDVRGQWYLVAKNFTAYYRLMITHLGIPRWHYAFTDVGLDPLTKFWFGFLAPERLAIDLERDHTKVGIAPGRPPIDSTLKFLLKIPFLSGPRPTPGQDCCAVPEAEQEAPTPPTTQLRTTRASRVAEGTLLAATVTTRAVEHQLPPACFLGIDDLLFLFKIDALIVRFTWRVACFDVATDKSTLLSTRGVSKHGSRR